MRLDDFYKMAWYEYLLKCYSYNRQSKEEMQKVRFIAYHSHISSNIKLQKIPTLDQFLPMKGERKNNVVSQGSKEKYLAEYKDYLEKKQSKNGV